MHFAINRSRLTNGLDLASTTGIEIGPLVNPVVTRSVSDVKYVDRASTAELREWYSRDKTINVDDIMEIDFIWGDQSLSQATNGTEHFDYCVASHVIEHIPDLITWLGEIASILKTGGLACFAVPDKRYTFDYLRPLTTTADLVECYLNKLRKPSSRHIYDHFSNFAELDINTAWEDGFNGSTLVPLNPPIKAYKACLESLEGDKYIDSHCSVFTEESFFPLLASISSLGLLDFVIKKKFSVRSGMFEFVVQLEKLDPSLSAEQKHQAFMNSLEEMQASALLMEFSSNTVCIPKLYYSSGEGFNETESVEVKYVGAGKLTQLCFPLPQLDQLKLRFDPSEHECRFKISQLSLTSNGDNTDLPLEALTPLNEIAKVKITRAGLSAKTTKGATDPSFLIAV